MRDHEFWWRGLEHPVRDPVDPPGPYYPLEYPDCRDVPPELARERLAAFVELLKREKREREGK